MISRQPTISRKHRTGANSATASRRTASATRRRDDAYHNQTSLSAVVEAAAAGDAHFRILSSTDRSQSSRDGSPASRTVTSRWTATDTAAAMELKAMDGVVQRSNSDAANSVCMQMTDDSSSSRGDCHSVADGTNNQKQSIFDTLIQLKVLHK
jgi:hypothetical protein